MDSSWLLLFIIKLYSYINLFIEVKIDANSGFINRIYKCLLLSGTFDLPARSLVMETVKFKGKYGYIKCYQERESCKAEKGGNVWV